jgi:alpha-glucosidase
MKTMKMLPRIFACAALAAALSLPVAAAGYGGFEVQSVFADGSALYVSPQEPSSTDPVTLKLRVGKGNVAAVLLHVGDAVLPMAKLASEGSFDYYFAELAPLASPTRYYFELKRGGFALFYGRRGLEQKAPETAYQFGIAPGFKVPAWMKGAVLYQIYVDRFANGDKSNDVLTNEYLYDNWPSVRVEDWDQLPDATTPYAAGGNRTREFFGGDLEGIIQKLGYLKDLGVDGIYLNPIFVSPSNHKYDSQDYEHVDPHFGVIVRDGGELVDPTKDPNYRKAGASDASAVNRGATKYRIRTTDAANLAASDAKFKELVDKAHELGIRVILDGVFNHSGSFNKWFDREGIYPADQGPGAYESESSPFASYYSFAKKAWPNNESYEAWSGFKTLPKLNYEGSRELERKVLDIGATWVGPAFGADGWRLDVATELGHSPKYNHRFWSMFRSSVKAANPEAVILAEVYGDASSWLGGDEWDTVMNYDAFFEPLGWYFTGLEKHSYYYREKLYNDTRTLASDLREKMAKLPYASLEIAMNELDNHDHSRFLTRTSGFVDDQRSSSDVSPQDKAGVGVNKGVLKEATILQMCLPGAPTLYYGDEAGLAGFTDPDDRRTYPWGKEDSELLAFFKDAIAVHKEYSALKTGSFAMLSTGSYGLFAFGRWDRASRVVVAINNTKSAQSMEIPVGAMGLEEGEKLELVLTADREGHGRPGGSFVVAGGDLTLSVPAFGGVVLASKSGSKEPEPVVTARPAIKTVSPAPGSANASPNAAIVIVFAEPMEQRGVADAFSIAPAVAGRFVWNGNAVSFLPAAPLTAGSYTVRVSGDMRALRGGFRLGAPKSWSFTVK